jgi:DNA-binding MarR family transcriptional regulator
MAMNNKHLDDASTLSQYNGNLPRHLIALSRYIQSNVMQRLQESYQHQGLRMSFEPYISMIGEGCRLTELAERLGISKQSCNQTANQMEKAGYIQRVPDPLDGRGKIVVLTPQGKKLVKDGYKVITAITQGFDGHIGSKKLATLTELLLKLAQGLSLPNIEIVSALEPAPILLGTILPRCSDHVMQRLMNLTIAKGHPALKMSHGTVLTLIGSKNAHIRDIAKIQAISKQAVSAIVKDLEELGYVTRKADPDYPRQNLLLLTDRGSQLIADSVGSVNQLESEFKVILGANALQQLRSISKELFLALELEAQYQETSNTDLQQLARQLKLQLGEQALNELISLLKKG